MIMDNKFYSKDISKFDPTNASAQDIRKWLFAIIDAELEKAPEERDYDLIAECSEFEAELPMSDFELSENEYAAGLERIKAQAPAAEHKETKILKPKKKTKRSVRIIAVLAASLATLILSLTVAASVQGKPVIQFITDNVKVILGMDTGDKLEEGDITLIKYGESSQYSSVEEAVSALEHDILYPSYLPEGIKIERIVATDNGQEGTNILFVTNTNEISIRITISSAPFVAPSKDFIEYDNGIIKFYIVKKPETVQVFGEYQGAKYGVVLGNYDELTLINILEGIKEIEK